MSLKTTDYRLERDPLLWITVFCWIAMMLAVAFGGQS